MCYRLIRKTKARVTNISAMIHIFKFGIFDRPNGCGWSPAPKMPSSFHLLAKSSEPIRRKVWLWTMTSRNCGYRTARWITRNSPRRRKTDNGDLIANLRFWSQCIQHQLIRWTIWLRCLSWRNSQSYGTFICAIRKRRFMFVNICA